jgi:hypothetical protein
LKVHDLKLLLTHVIFLLHLKKRFNVLPDTSALFFFFWLLVNTLAQALRLKYLPATIYGLKIYEMTSSPPKKKVKSAQGAVSYIHISYLHRSRDGVDLAHCSKKGPLIIIWFGPASRGARSMCRGPGRPEGAVTSWVIC